MTPYIADVAVFGYMGGLQRPTGVQTHITAIMGGQSGEDTGLLHYAVLGFEKIRGEYLKAVPRFGL